VSDELIYLEFALHVIVNQVWELGAALNSAKSASLEGASSESFSAKKKKSPYLPNATSNELECCGNI
jgi:hypothetical protein